MAGSEASLRFLFDVYGAGPVIDAAFREMSASAAPAAPPR